MPRVVGTRCGVNSTCDRPARDLRQRLLHLGRVAMRQQPVGGDVLVRLGEQARRLQAPTRARDARDRVGDDARLDEPEREQRRAREAHRGRVAAGCGDVRVRREVVAVQLDHPVREPADDLRRAVRLAVPARVRVGRETEVGAEIDHVRHVVEQPGQEVLARAVRAACRTRGRGRAGRRRRAARAPCRRRPASSDGIQVGEARARVRGGRDVHDLDLGVPGEQPERLDPRIP